MSNPQLTQASGQPFYILEGSDEAGITTAFVPRNPGGAGPATLSQSWTTNGVFFFMPAEPADIGAFVSGTRALFNAPLNDALRMVWLENPDDPLHLWRTNRLYMEAGNDGRVVRTSYIDIKNYAVSVASGATGQLAGTRGSAVPAVVLRHEAPAKGIGLHTGFGAHRIAGGVAEVRIPMAGQQMGCITFDLSIPSVPTLSDTDTTFGYPELAELDVSLRLFARDARFLAGQAEAAQVRSIRYPFFNEKDTSLKAKPYYPESIDFGVSLDPLDALNASRAFFDLKTPTAPLHGQTGIPTAFRTNLGRNVHVLPESKSRFVFASRVSSVAGDTSESPALYLVPEGAFRLLVPRYKPDASVDLTREENIICGLSGVEYVKLPAGNINRMHFKSGSKAFLPGFVGASALLQDLPFIVQENGQGQEITEDLDTDKTLEDALGLDRAELDDILERVRLDYFPPNHQFTDAELEAYRAVETIEEWTEWFEAAINAIKYPVSDDVLDALATTAWVYFTQENPTGSGVTNPVYYAQPDQAVLYKAPDIEEGDGAPTQNAFFEFMEVPSVGLPAPPETGDELHSFPMLPYGQVAGEETTDCHSLEVQLIAKYRRDRIAAISDAAGHATPLDAAATEDNDRIGTTPQGLLATFSADYRTYDELLLAKDTAGKDVLFAGIGHGEPVKSALQSSQLFMVADNPDGISRYFSSDVLSGVGGTNQLEIQEWIFNMDPETWVKRDTIMIFKFHDKPLLDLARDPNTWSESASLTRGVGDTSNRLVNLLEEAVILSQNPDPKIRRKYEDLARAAQMAGWTGILVLNVDVPLGTLPEQLRGLAAGIDADKFYAQYIGVSVTPIEIEGEVPVARQSSLFGLIDYNNDEPPPAPPDESAGYNFHVRILTVVFKNSQIADFAAEIIVTMDKLFGERTRLRNSENGKNTIILKGTAERHGDKTTYAFAFTGDNHFLMEESEVLEEVEVIKATFVTDPKDPNNPDRVQSRFFFWGRMNFRSLEGFDILSFGSEVDPDAELDTYLSFSNLQLLMRFDIPVFRESDGSDTRAFIFDPEKLVFDFKQSKVRQESLYAKFPLKLTQLQHSTGGEAALNAQGYMPVSSPITTGSVADDWYAMKFDLVLGTLGALAGGANLTVGIIVAWSPGEDHNGVFIGLKLPGATGGKKEINIQGVLKIVFKKIQFVVSQNETTGKTSYLLKLKNILLKVLVLSIPPNAQTEIIIFGDPDETGSEEKRSVGWYASYAKK